MYPYEAFALSRVTLDLTSMDLSEHHASVERAFLGVLDFKKEQSEKQEWERDTLLIVDLSRLGRAWYRDETVWIGQLEKLLDWATLPFAGAMVTYAENLRLPGAYILRPDLEPGVIRGFGTVVPALGFSAPDPLPRRARPG